MSKIQCCGNGINTELLKKFKDESKKIHPHNFDIIPNVVNKFTKSGFLKFHRD